MILPVEFNAPPRSLTSQDRPDLRRVAQDLEAAFLAEMLKTAGLGKSRSTFGGGAGEEQLSSFLVRAQAEAMARSGGLGLSEMFLKSLMEMENDGNGNQHSG